MQILQFQVSNDQIQDRLLLRISTTENQEVRIFVTRHFLREIWPLLVTALGSCQKPVTTSAEPAENTAVAGETAPHTAPAVPQEAGFNQEFREDNPTYPLGSNPVLASEIRLEKVDESSIQMQLSEGRERSFALGLSSDMLQVLCSMLRAASEQAHWDLALNYETPSGTGNAPSKQLLH